MTEPNIEAAEAARDVVRGIAYEALAAATYQVRARIPDASKAEVAALLAERVLRAGGVDVRQANP